MRQENGLRRKDPSQFLSAACPAVCHVEVQSALEIWFVMLTKTDRPNPTYKQRKWITDIYGDMLKTPDESELSTQWSQTNTRWLFSPRKILSEVNIITACWKEKKPKKLHPNCYLIQVTDISRQPKHFIIMDWYSDDITHKSFQVKVQVGGCIF